MFRLCVDGERAWFVGVFLQQAVLAIILWLVANIMLNSSRRHLSLMIALLCVPGEGHESLAGTSDNSKPVRQKFLKESGWRRSGEPSVLKTSHKNLGRRSYSLFVSSSPKRKTLICIN